MCENGEIIVKNIGLQLPHLSYCDLSPCQNLAMKFGKRNDSIMIQYPSKFCGMSMNTSQVRNNNIIKTAKVETIASQSK